MRSGRGGSLRPGRGSGIHKPHEREHPCAPLTNLSAVRGEWGQAEEFICVAWGCLTVCVPCVCASLQAQYAGMEASV